MKRNLALSLCLCLVTVYSCKKDISFKDKAPIPITEKSKTLMTLPGQGSSGSYLVPKSTGGYSAQWYGNMTFGDIPHAIVNVTNGEPVNDLNIQNIANEYIAVLTIGPYFTVIRPTFVGDPNITRDEFKAFSTAYTNYINQVKDEFGALKQPGLPVFDSFVHNNGNGEIIVKGMVVYSTTSPSKMTIVPTSFVPPSMQPQ